MKVIFGKKIGVFQIELIKYKKGAYDDLLRILFCWLVELMGFSGYSFQDAGGLDGWVLSEMEF